MKELEGPFRINGTAYTKEELLTYAEKQMDNPAAIHWEKDLYSFILDFLNPQIPLLQKSSGTTGDPKTISLSRAAMLNSASNTLEFFQLEPGNKALLCLPVNFIAGKMMVVRAMLGGMELLTIEPGGNPLINLDEEVHFAAMVPLQMYEALKTPTKLSLIEKLILGGGEIHSGLKEQIGMLKDTEVFETFAMSETYSHFAVKKLNGEYPEDTFTIMEGVSIDIDPRSCLVVDIKGITNGPVVSNDLVELSGPRHFRWMGRADYIIKSGGMKIIPEILEKRIDEKLGIESIFLGIKDLRFGEKMVMVLEKATFLQHPGLKNDLEKILAKHEFPKSIEFIERFPRNRSYKIDRREIAKILS